MCLAVSGQIQRIEHIELGTGKVSFAGVTKEVCLTLVPEASVGNYVIVHVGFAISKVDEQSVKESLSMIEKLSYDQCQQVDDHFLQAITQAFHVNHIDYVSRGIHDEKIFLHKSPDKTFKRV